MQFIIKVPCESSANKMYADYEGYVGHKVLKVIKSKVLLIKKFMQATKMCIIFYFYTKITITLDRITVSFFTC